MGAQVSTQGRGIVQWHRGRKENQPTRAPIPFLGIGGDWWLLGIDGDWSPHYIPLHCVPSQDHESRHSTSHRTLLHDLTLKCIRSNYGASRHTTRQTTLQHATSHRTPQHHMTLHYVTVAWRPLRKCILLRYCVGR